jgi:hypothetical protein
MLLALVPAAPKGLQVDASAVLGADRTMLGIPDGGRSDAVRRVAARLDGRPAHFRRRVIFIEWSPLDSTPCG